MFTSKLRAMWHDEDAVSPVIGVILMVAVTVVLAAVIGAFVFGMGDSLNSPAPSTQVEFSYNADAATIHVNHAGGTTINPDNTGKLLIRTNTAPANADISWAGTINSTTPATSAVIDGNEAVTAGQTIVTVTDFQGGEHIELVWQSPDGSSSQVLGKYTAD